MSAFSCSFLLSFDLHRLGIPSATVYYSYSFGYWATGDNKIKTLDDPVALAAKDALCKAYATVEPYTEPYKSDAVKKWNNFAPIKMWNCSVRCAFRHLSQFDPAKQAVSLYQKAISAGTENKS